MTAYVAAPLEYSTPLHVREKCLKEVILPIRFISNYILDSFCYIPIYYSQNYSAGLYSEKCVKAGGGVGMILSLYITAIERHLLCRLGL